MVYIYCRVSYDCNYYPDIPDFVLRTDEYIYCRMSYDCYYDPDIPDMVVVD